MTHSVFISYSTTDHELAFEVCAALEAGGLACWIAGRDAQSGDMWDESIIEAIESCRVVVLVFTSNSNASRDVAIEVKQAGRRRKTIIPFRLEALEPGRALEYYLTAVQWYDATTAPHAGHLPGLVERVRREVEGEVEAAQRRSLAEQEAGTRALKEAWARARDERREAARRRKSEPRGEPAPGRKYTAELRVPAASPLVGQGVAESGLQDALNLAVVGVIRGTNTRLPPRDDLILEADDTLLVMGGIEDLLDTPPESYLKLAPAEEFDLGDLTAGKIRVFEAMVLRGSEMNGRNLRSLSFRDRYGLTVLGISRHGIAFLTRLPTVTLRFGDALLLVGEEGHLERLVGDGNLLDLSEETELEQKLWLRSLKRQARDRAYQVAFRWGLPKLVSIALIAAACLSVIFSGLNPLSFSLAIAASVTVTYYYARFGKR